MSDTVFQLDNFRGPMDLLLHLIREQELEITEVDLSALCDQYLHVIEAMQAVDINVAGEFLVMASTLLLIKSRTLLPREEEVDLEEELDPGDELIQQLLEYRRYKTLSMELGRRAEQRSLRMVRGDSEVPPDEQNELAEVALWDLVGSYVRLVEELGLQRNFHTLQQEKPLRAYLRETLAHLAERNRWSLKELLTAGQGGDSVFGYFLSLLELVKTRQVTVLNDGSEGDIVVELRQDRDTSRLSFLYDGSDDVPDSEAVPDEADEPDTAGAGDGGPDVGEHAARHGDGGPEAPRAEASPATTDGSVSEPGPEGPASEPADEALAAFDAADPEDAGSPPVGLASDETISKVSPAPPPEAEG